MCVLSCLLLIFLFLNTIFSQQSVWRLINFSPLCLDAFILSACLSSAYILHIISQHSDLVIYHFRFMDFRIPVWQKRVTAAAVIPHHQAYSVLLWASWGDLGDKLCPLWPRQILIILRSDFFPQFISLPPSQVTIITDSYRTSNLSNS